MRYHQNRKSIRTTWRILLAVSVLLLGCTSAIAAQTHWIVQAESLPAGAVVPNNVQKSFASLNEAVESIALFRSGSGSNSSDEIIIHLQPGKYRLAKPITFTARESGAQGAQIQIVGPADKKAFITGGRALDGWRAVSDSNILERNSASAKQQIVQFNLRDAGITDYGALIRRGFGQDPGAVGQVELFFRGKPMTLARWPNEGYAKLKALPKAISAATSFLALGANIAGLASEKHLLATGYWGKDWADETIPVNAVHVESGAIELQMPGPKLGIVDGQRYFLQNALCELDAPGEWYLDRATGVLYFWPPEPIKKGDVELSILPSLVVTNGASNLSMTGITFEMSRGDAIAINGGANVQVRDSTIRNTGGRAAKAGGEAHKFVNVDVYDVGEGGIYLGGGDRNTLKPGVVTVENSRIRRFNRLSRTYRPAIQLGGVGNRAVGNVISDGTHVAILFYGNNHLISYNEVSEVVQETGDAGAIYTGRDWTARGTVIQNNYLHDIHGPGIYGSRGIYLDDQASGIVVKQNLFVRVDRPIFVGGGRDNRIEGNLMVSSSPAIHLDARGLTWQRSQTVDPKGELRKKLREVPIDREPYRDQYPQLAKILEDDPGAPKNNVIRNNAVIDGKALDMEEGAGRWLTGEAVIKAGEIRFVRETGAKGGKRATDFAIEAKSSTVNSGLQGLPLAAMDCIADRWQRMDRGMPAAPCKLD